MKIKPVQPSGQQREDVSLVYELIRENQSLLLTLRDSRQNIVKLRIDAVEHEVGHLQLSLKLEHATEELERLTVQLADARKEIGRLALELHKP